jgi:putative flippase GtrA
MRSTREGPRGPLAGISSELAPRTIPSLENATERRSRHARRRAWHARFALRAEPTRGRRELSTLARAGVSSFVATLNDGFVYQGLLTVTRGHYGLAAFAGAALGAVMNFSLNRAWAFRGPWKAMWLQASQYALGALITFLSLQVMLSIFIEGLGMGARIAWIPAKTLTFALVGYPIQRFLVFGKYTLSQQRKRV